MPSPFISTTVGHRQEQQSPNDDSQMTNSLSLPFLSLSICDRVFWSGCHCCCFFVIDVMVVIRTGWMRLKTCSSGSVIVDGCTYKRTSCTKQKNKQVTYESGTSKCSLKRKGLVVLVSWGCAVIGNFCINEPRLSWVFPSYCINAIQSCQLTVWDQTWGSCGPGSPGPSVRTVAGQVETRRERNFGLSCLTSWMSTKTGTST